MYTIGVWNRTSSLLQLFEQLVHARQLFTQRGMLTKTCQFAHSKRGFCKSASTKFRGPEIRSIEPLGQVIEFTN